MPVTRHPVPVALALFVAIALGTVPALSQVAPLPERQVKAAFLYNFVKFIAWPPEDLVEARGAVNLCVVGRDSILGPLERLVAGKSIDQRPLKVSGIENVNETRSCRLLFLGSEQSRAREFLAATRSLPILTVGEEASFGAWGGIITLVMENNQVRFEINLEAADRAGLKVSSKLLALARAVNVGKGGS